VKSRRIENPIPPPKYEAAARTQGGMKITTSIVEEGNLYRLSCHQRIGMYRLRGLPAATFWGRSGFEKQQKEKCSSADHKARVMEIQVKKRTSNTSTIVLIRNVQRRIALAV
jgi:hypothetical protein